MFERVAAFDPAPRPAVIPPGAAVRWVMGQLRHAGVNGAAVRSTAAFWRQAGRVGDADDLERAWRELATAEHDAVSRRTRRGTAEHTTAEPEPRSIREHVTTAEAADQLGVTDRYVRQLLAIGALDGSRSDSGSWLVTVASIGAWKATR